MSIMEANIKEPGKPIGGGVKQRISWTELKYILRKQGVLKPNETLRAVESDGSALTITIENTDEEIHVS